MRNRGATLEQLEALAKHNGYKQGARKADDAKRKLDGHKKKTKADQDRTLRKYIK